MFLQHRGRIIEEFQRTLKHLEFHLRCGIHNEQIEISPATLKTSGWKVTKK